MVKATDSSADARPTSLRSRVVWIALAGMIATVAALGTATAMLLFVNARSQTDEEMARQLTNVMAQVRQAAAKDLPPQLREVVEATSASRFTVVALHPDGTINATSMGPRSIREALERDSAAFASAASSATANSLKVGDSSLRYVASDTSDASRVLVVANSDDIRDDAVRAAALVAGLGLLCVLAGAAATTWALNRAIRPLTELAERAKEIGAGVQQRLPVTNGPVEVQDLAAHMNGLLSRIEAEQRRRNTFLATISHEVRTPLAIAQGHLEALSSYRPPSTADSVASLAVARSELARTGRMVEGLLTLARAAEPGFVHIREVALRDFADDLALRLAGLDVAVAVAPPPDRLVRIDSERVAQAILSAVTNSMVHNDDTVRVRVSWTIFEDALGIVIEDTGAGFPPLPVGELLQPFMQGTPGTSGLGLAVIDTIARSHGGSVALGESPIGGARVTIRLVGAVLDAPSPGSAQGPPESCHRNSSEQHRHLPE